VQHLAGTTRSDRQAAMERGGAPLPIGGRTLGRIGPLEVRLARDEAEVAAAQKVRYKVFVEEQGASAERMHALDRRDGDRFDPVCDHMLVLDQSLGGEAGGRIVGTYRLLRAEGAAAAGGFYSEGEFDIAALTALGDRFLELGRSCVLPAYRSKRTIEVLWQGIWAYVQHHGIAVMGGCASLRGTVPAEHAQALSFLAHHCRADAAFPVRALPGRYCVMDLMPAEAVDVRSAFQSLPPLIKGYLRLGAGIGDGCVVDADFGTVDVFVVLPVSAIARRYISYYS
jgi:putative hemolysin